MKRKNTRDARTTLARAEEARARSLRAGCMAGGLVASVLGGAGCKRANVEMVASVVQAASLAGEYDYGFDPSGLATSVGTSSASYAIQRQGASLTAGTDNYAFDALGRIGAIDGTSIVYGPDGQIDHSTNGAQTVSYVSDEEGHRLLKSVNGVPTIAYDDANTITETELAEPVRVGGKLVGLLRNGVFSLTAADLRGTIAADTSGTPRLASPFGARPVHPDVAPTLDYAAKGFDADLGAGRMGVRDYDARIARFLEPDPLVLTDPSLCVKSPDECNLYGYAKDRPNEFVDATGTCAAPALSGGQVGVCVEAFISTPHIGTIGIGDNRTFAANDPSKTQRVQLQFVFDEKGHLVGAPDVHTARSAVGVSWLALQGTTAMRAETPWTDSDGGSNYRFGIKAWNGFANLPAAPHAPILLDLGLRVLPGGEVQLDGGRGSAYPSIGVYSYHLDDQGHTQSTTLFEAKETKPDELGKWGLDIPSTRH